MMFWAWNEFENTNRIIYHLHCESIIHHMNYMNVDERTHTLTIKRLTTLMYD